MEHLVSILIPTYNGAAFLLDALESANTQTYSNCEIVISDDRSLDETLNIVEKFRASSKFPIKVYTHAPAGIGENWNNCVKNADGEFMKFLFQDDVLKPDCIEKLVNMAQLDPEVGLVYCRRDFLFTTSIHRRWIDKFKELHIFWGGFTVKEGVLDGKKYLKDPKIFHFPDNKIGEPSAVLLRKRVFEKVGYFRKDLNQLLDVEYWYRTMKYFKVGFVDEKLVYFRLHEDQATIVNLNKGISDYHNFYHIFYHDFLRFLNIRVQWKLIWKVTRLRRISRIFKSHNI